jgi:hypothetical protein
VEDGQEKMKQSRIPNLEDEVKPSRFLKMQQQLLLQPNDQFPKTPLRRRHPQERKLQELVQHQHHKDPRRNLMQHEIPPPLNDHRHDPVS